MNERIKELRKSLNLSQKEFASSLGISDAAVSKIESGINNPAENTIRLICATYHVNYKWLTTGEGVMNEKQDTDALVEKYMAGESEFAKSIMKAFAKLPDEEWIRLRDMIERIKKEGD